MDKREKELRIVELMIRIYCKRKHKEKQLCAECQQLLEYAKYRTSVCPFMETKTFCANCKVHCYKGDVRDKIREVMRFSGPWMLLYHPLVAIKHVIETRKEKRK